jgi:hypothetical protein
LTDKYSGYDHSIARILRGFDEWVNEQNQIFGIKTSIMAGIIGSTLKLVSLADLAQREIDEARAAE